MAKNGSYAKYALIAALVVSTTVYAAKISGTFGAQTGILPALIGIALFSAGNAILWRVAEKFDEYRNVAIFASISLLLANSALFVGSLFYPILSMVLFVATLMQAVGASALLWAASRFEKIEGRLSK